jgi:hypothetical protein
MAAAQQTLAEEKNEPAWAMEGPADVTPITFIPAAGSRREINFTWDELDALKRVAQAQLEIEAKRRNG